MQHYPIFLAVAGRRICVVGGGWAAIGKLRTLMKTEGLIEVYARETDPQIDTWEAEGKLRVIRRAFTQGDAQGAVLVYAAADEEVADAETARLGRAAGVLVNIVDNLQDSQFITPAIVDRDPVTVAIGTEGAAPVLARAIKADLEERLPTGLGTLARVGKTFREMVERLPFGARRRDFWSDYYFNEGPRALTQGEDALQDTLDDLLARHEAKIDAPGHVAFVGAGPGDPELLTLKARRLLHEADVVIHDGLVPDAIIDLARREANIIPVGKTGYGAHTPQGDINALLVEHAEQGAKVVRLKGGDPVVFGRLDEEIEALDARGLDWSVVPGITAASASAAAIGQSLTRRGRNTAARLLTAHDVDGFAEHDWTQLARPGEVAAIYMGKRAARFLQGRLMMHGADRFTPVTVIENASRPDQRVLGATLDTLTATLTEAGDGPALILFGLAPRDAVTAQQTLEAL